LSALESGAEPENSMTRTISVGSHTIDLWASPWNGRESVTVDGRLVSEKRSYRMTSLHRFTLDEDGVPVDYAAVIAGMLGYSVHRNGVLVASEYSKWAGFFLSAGLLILALKMIEGLLVGVAAATGVARLATAATFLNELDFFIAVLGALWLMRQLKARVVRSVSGSAPPALSTPE
jgi:hypothetical protein